MHREHLFCQINSNGSSLAHGFPFADLIEEQSPQSRHLDPYRDGEVAQIRWGPLSFNEFLAMTRSLSGGILFRNAEATEVLRDVTSLVVDK